MIDPVDVQKEPRLCAAILIAAIVCLAGSTSALALDFKGVELGQTLWASQERSVFGELDCNPLGLSQDEYRSYVREMRSVMPEARKVCAASTSIATVPADVTVVLGPSRRVLRLTFQFDGEHYTRVVDAMTLKWGAGLVDTRNRFDESVWWDFEDGSSISVHQTPGDIGADEENETSLVGLAEYTLALATPAGDL